MKPSVNWDDHADFYNEMAMMELPYTGRQLDCLEITPEDTVLDIGCGPGRLSILAAERAKSVTSLDAAPKMLEHLKENARARGIADKVSPVLMNYFDVIPDENIQKHDIVYASRTEAMRDIDGLSQLARKYAAVMIWANAPSIPEIINELYLGVQADADTPHMPPRGRAQGYNQFFNRVYNLGYEPNVKIMTDGFTKTFSGTDAALAYFWALKPDLPESGKARLLENLKPYLTNETDGAVTFRYETRTAVIWWKPEKGKVVETPGDGQRPPFGDIAEK